MKFQSESDKEVERGEILSDDDRSMINEEINEDHVQMPAYLAGMDLVNTDQADVGRSGNRFLGSCRLCDGGDLVSKDSLQEDLSTAEN
eukprot:7397075-Karenia_brevis.AAC.1